MTSAQRVQTVIVRTFAVAVVLACSGVVVAQPQFALGEGETDRAYRPQPLALAADQEATPPAQPAAAPEQKAEEKPLSFDMFSLSGKRMTGEWGGIRPWMDENGIDFSVIYVGTWQQNFRGGIETHNADDFCGDLRLNLYVDLDKLKIIPGGFIFARGKSSYNDSVQRNVGSLGSTAWVVASGDHEIFLDKWWYGQKFFDGMLEFRAGKLLTPIDLFDQNAYAMNPWDQFMNQNVLVNPTVPHRKAPGAYMKFQPVDWAYFSMAGLNADQTDSTHAFDAETTFHDDPSFIGIWETGFMPKFQGANGKLPGNYRFGVHYDARPVTVYRDTLGGVRQMRQRNEDVGFYTSMDQLLWKENNDPKDKQGLGAFFRYGFAHRDVNRVSHYWSIGAQYQGLIPTRDKDVVAFGVGQSILSSQFRHQINHLADRETVYELYYSIEITPWLVLTPDIQFITEPGGMKNARDALVGSLRVKLNL